jgi:hypothetical protein
LRNVSDWLQKKLRQGGPNDREIMNCEGYLPGRSTLSGTAPTLGWHVAAIKKPKTGF